MNKIFCIVGKSASGKDTIYKEIVSAYKEELVGVVLGTTRPMRIGEKDGIDYRFFTDEQLLRLEREGKVIEKRQYDTMQGIWSYFTLEFDLSCEKNHILITTLEGAKSITKHYGEDKVRVIYLAIDDKERLLRCIDRESRQENPDYSEVCRRFIADQKDFSAEKIGELKNIYYIDSSKSVTDCLNQWNELYLKLK